MSQKAMQTLRGDQIVARDGSVGSLRDLYFDDERWAVRYLVVDTGDWLPGHKVLISPASVAPTQGGNHELRLDLTREQVEGAPGIDSDPPISRMLETAHARHFGYPYYWQGPYLWGLMPLPPRGLARDESRQAQAGGYEEVRQMADQRAQESHLRSSAEVVGYRIQAVDGEIGHVEDFLIDDESWAITGMVVDTRNWLPGRKVLLAPSAVTDISWQQRQVSVRLPRDEIEQAARAE